MNVLLGVASVVITINLAASSKVEYSTQCSDDGMNIWVRGSDLLHVELHKWGIMDGCGGNQHDSYYHFYLPIRQGRLHCGLTRVKNKLTGDIVYYHRLGVTTLDKDHRILLVKCSQKLGNSTLSNRVKRDVLPPEFVEPDYIEITSEVSASAPVPILGVGVRQNGNLVDGQINVLPGTPLTMEVFLDDISSNIYGILVSYMEVTDTNDKQETIVYNGCTVDSYLFENFVTETGDYLAAKFRAFKFPDSSFVLFQGTVDVCIDKCNGIPCSNGQLGYGRKRRSVLNNNADPNKIFEVTMETFIKFEETVIKPEFSLPINKKEPINQISTNQHFFEDYFLRGSEKLNEAPLLEREPPSIIFTSGSAAKDQVSWLLISVLVLLYRV